MKETFSVGVESVSSFEATGNPEIIRSCGHAHKTLQAAQRCRDKLTEMSCDHGTPAGHRCSLCTGGRALPQKTSALWYRARIHNNLGQRVE